MTVHGLLCSTLQYSNGQYTVYCTVYSSSDSRKHMIYIKQNNLTFSMNIKKTLKILKCELIFFVNHTIYLHIYNCTMYLDNLAVWSLIMRSKLE